MRKLRPREREWLAQGHTTGTIPAGGVGDGLWGHQQALLLGAKVRVELVAGYRLSQPGYATRLVWATSLPPPRGRAVVLCGGGEGY